MNSCPALVDLLDKSIHSEPPVLISKGGVIREGISAELDELRQIAFAGKDYLLQVQNREIERTGIS